MIFVKKKLVFFVSVLLLLAVMGCSKDLPSETDLPDKEPIPVNEMENEDFSNETGLDEDESPKEYYNFAEAYIDILVENNIEQNNPISVGDRKISVVDVFGDETPELLYIYRDFEISDLLKIYTFSNAEGVESVFDACVFTAAGGGGNYCIYLTNDRELMAYYSSNNYYTSSGFWPLIALSMQEQEEQQTQYFNNRDSAQLYYSSYYDEDASPKDVLEYAQYGNEISKTRFDEIVQEIMDNIDHVIFQSSEIYSPYGLYESEELWKDVTPYHADCMTYEEAISWLEAQKS